MSTDGLYPISLDNDRPESAPLFPRKSRPPSVPRGNHRYAANLSAALADVRTMLCDVDAALKAEGTTPDLRRRVLNRLLFGNPEGINE